MPLSIQEYSAELMQEVLTGAHANETFVEDQFFERTTHLLMDAGEIENADRARYQHTGLRVDGYGGDPLTEDGVLSLITLDFVQSQDIGSLTNTDIQAAFRRLESFLKRSADGGLGNEVEETSPGFGLADLIAARWDGVSRVRLFLVSNRVLSTRVDGREVGDIQG